MKIRLAFSVLVVVLMVSRFAVASPVEGDDEVLFQGTPFCVGQEDCRAFAFWGGTVPGYIVLTETNGTPSDYLWVDFRGFLWFESDDENGHFAVLPPAGLPLLGTLVEDGTLQQVNQFFLGGTLRPLFVQSSPAEAVPEPSTLLLVPPGAAETVPEPSTLLLVAPGALLLFGRARRFWRH